MSVSVPHLVVCLLYITSVVNAQDTLEPGKNPCSIQAKVVPLPPLREADVMWARRVWRVVDVNDPLNRSLAVPQGEGGGCMGLINVVRYGLLDEGSITAYDAGPLGKDDAFQRPMSRKEVSALYAALDTTDEMPVSRIMNKEDWIFDRQRGEMIVRIIGIAPMLELRGELGELRGYAPLFWLYYPECRLLFARWVNGEDKEGNVRSYESYFAERRFESTITKVSNVQDRQINESHSGLDALLESDAIRDQLHNMGFDLWHY